MQRLIFKTLLILLSLYLPQGIYAEAISNAVPERSGEPISIEAPPLTTELDSVQRSTPQETKSWLQVEIIVFAQSDQYGDEQPRKDIQLSYPDNLVRLHQLNGNNTQQPLQKLSSREFNLHFEATKLTRSNNYRVLYHQAWRQPELSPRQSPWIALQGGDQYGQNFELEGSIRVVKSRFLHTEVNLWLGQLNTATSVKVTSATQPLPNEVPQKKELSPYGNDQSTPESPVSASSKAVDIASKIYNNIETLQGSQRIHMGKLHYFDHPRLGVLVKIQPYLPADSNPASTAEIE